jgi:hypothetical protein
MFKRMALKGILGEMGRSENTSKKQSREWALRN